MLRAAIFGALADEQPRLRRLETTSRLVCPGTKAVFPAKPRHPKAVVNVGRFQRQKNRPRRAVFADRDMQFVGRDEAERLRPLY